MDMTVLPGSLPVSGAEAASTETVSLALPTASVNDLSTQDGLAFRQAAGIESGTSGNLNGPSLAEQVIDKVQALSSSAAEKGQELERLVIRATDTLNPADVIAANRMMSEYYLENLMTAKMIGNATSAIERLTSLQ